MFFGILHVPLNIPALGVSLAEDNVKLDRELVAHGFSNFGAGLLGTVPNYLTYVNSVLCRCHSVFLLTSSLPRRRWHTPVGCAPCSRHCVYYDDGSYSHRSPP